MTPPSSIAHYRITGKLGEGGMGAVYRASDTKLNRDVAIKVLPDSFADNPDRLARFQREAQLLGSLNHPNIAAIYGLEDRALVLELVEGPTLADRIAQGPLPVEEALTIARQIADALEYSHEKSIIHRDLKPANVKVTPDGRVKVLDFGLAKALSADVMASDPASSPTMTMRATMAGMIMGTAGYMSPEQAKAKPVDRRSDIWSFGIVLIEMLSGRQVYTGETAAEILAGIIKEAVPLSGLPADVPQPIRRLLDRCLDKDPRRRLRDIGEARVVIEDVLAGRVPAEPDLANPAPAPRSAILPWALAGLMALVAVATGSAYWQGTRRPLRPLIRFDVNLGGAIPANPIPTRMAISPDGSRIVFTSTDAEKRSKLFTRLLDQAEGSPLTGTEDGEFPFFSPDGKWLGFAADGKLKKLPLLGGSPIVICDTPRFRGGSWGAGFIAAALDLRGGISRVSEDGGTPAPLTTLDAANNEVTHRFPFVLPGGKIVLFVADSKGGNYEEADIVAQSVETGRRSVLHHKGYYPRYVPLSADSGGSGKGFLLYMSESSIYAALMDPDRLVLLGAPVRVMDSISAAPGTGNAQFDVSRNGIALFVPGGNENEKGLYWMDDSGVRQALPSKSGQFFFPAVSPDGKSIAYLSLAAGVYSLWVHDTNRDTSSRLSIDGPTGANGLGWTPPVWSPDGKHLILTPAGRDMVLWTRADGSGQPQVLANERYMATSFSPDRRHLAVNKNNSGRSRVHILPIDGVETDRPTVGTPEEFPGAQGQWGAKFSPDGRWIAYTSQESGAAEVYVRDYPAYHGKWQVSNGGGQYPTWSPKTRELFYLSADAKLMALTYTMTADAFVPGKVRLWADLPGYSRSADPAPHFDIAPDGKRFLILLRPNTESLSSPSTVLLNFTDELRRRVQGN